MHARTTLHFVYFLVLLIALPTWELASRSVNSVRLLISSPSLVLQFVSHNISQLALDTAVTSIEALCGLLIALVTSFGLVVLTFFAPALLRFLTPAMIASQVIPLIVLAPFFVLAFGIGLSSKMAMAAVLCFFPLFVGLAQGYRLIPQDVHDLLDVYNAPTTTRIAQVYLPLSLPSAMAGLKVSATLSVIGAIVAEFTGSEMGLGRNLFLSTIRLQPELMIASLIGSSILGAAMYGAVHFLEGRIGFWYLPRRED